MGEALEFMNGDWDAVCIVNMGDDGISVIIWMMTRVQPQSKVTELRVSTYEDLYKRFKLVMRRRERTNPTTLRQALAALENRAPLAQRLRHRACQDVWFKGGVVLETD